MNNWYEMYKVDVPEGAKGVWRVERFSVSDDDAKFHNLRCSFSPGEGRRTIDPGVYTRLYRGSTLVMSDTPAEIADHHGFIRRSYGRVLINGLGIGMVARGCLLKPDVTSVEVIELDQDLIDLVGPHYKRQFGDRLTIICADAYTYQPPKGARWDAIWHDIWDGITSDNLEGVKRLHRKYGRRTESQGSWCRGQCEMYREWGR